MKRRYIHRCSDGTLIELVVFVFNGKVMQGLCTFEFSDLSIVDEWEQWKKYVEEDLQMPNLGEQIVCMDRKTGMVFV